MHLCKIPAIRAVTWAAVILAVLAMAAASSPARAAGDVDTKGWFLTLDLALTQPTGLEQQYALQVDPTSLPEFVSVKRLNFKNDSDFTGAIKFGYGFGNGMGKLQVSYWGFDNEDEVKGNVPGALLPTVFGYGYNAMYLYNSYGYGSDVVAKSKVQATTIDVDYLRSYEVGKKTAVTWLAGLRSATYEETQDFLGTDLYYGGTYQQHKNFKTDGLGLRLGAAVDFGFTEHFGLKGSTTFSFMQANTKGDSFQLFPNGDLETLNAKDDNVRGEIREYDLKAYWSYGMMDYFIGYRMENWDGMVADPTLLTGRTSSLQGRDSVAFNSLHTGVTFKFGAKK